MSDLNSLINGEMKPEDVFSLVTIMPKKKIKVTAYLEDKDGDRILVADIAENLTKYISDQMSLEDSTAVNSQMFPLCASFMTSIVPRFVGIKAAHFLFSGSIFRDSLLHLSLASVLFMQYVEQNELKIVTETIHLTDAEVEQYKNKILEMDNKFDQFFGEDNNNEDN